MRAKDVMTAGAITVSPEASVAEIAELLLSKRISAVPVIDEAGRLAGIVSEGDLIRRAETGTDRSTSWWLALLRSPEDRAFEYIKTHGLRARDVMTERVVTVDEETPIARIAALLEEKGIKRVPVVRDGRLVGIVSRADLLRGLVTAMPKTAEVDDEAIRRAILARIREDAGVRDTLLNVTVAEGVVHLWGAVPTEAERKAVHVAADNTPGTKGVVDHLRVQAVL